MKHSRLEGQHAFLGASKYSWLNYSDDKLIESYNNFIATQKGTELHALAAQLIKQKVRLPKTKQTFNMYVNDAIGFDLKPEQILYFSENCFGTADSIGFDDVKGYLRIHDLKTGINQASMHQLEIYAALFFLEYDIPINDIDIELRIYQNDDIIIENPGIEDIAPIMDKIITFDEIIEQLKKESDYES
jgi:hypothetical protein